MTRLTFLQPKASQPAYPLFVFLPGMDGTGQLLRTQLDRLQSLFDLRCLRIPAHDRSGWQSLASQVIALIQGELAVNPDRPVYLCGESFGGCLALQVIQQAPHVIDRLILVNPATSFHRVDWLKSVTLLTGMVPRHFYHWASWVLQQLIMVSDRVLTHDQQALLAAIQSVPQATAVWRIELLRTFELLTHTHLEHPTLILAGSRDRLLPSVAEAHHLSQQLSNAQSVVLPNSGHACLLEIGVDLPQIMAHHNFLPSMPIHRGNHPRSNILALNGY